MEAILLAGGLGTRLHKVTGDCYPKSLAEVDGRPFIHYVVQYLASMGVNRFIFAVSHHAQMIVDSIQNEFPDLDVDFSFEDQPLGTGGAIKQALNHVKGKRVLVVNSDSFMEFSLAQFIEFAEDKESNLSIVCTQVEDVSRFGAADVSEQGLLLKFFEKGRQGSGYINSGIYLIDKNHPKLASLTGKFSFENELLSNKEVPVFAIKNKGLFFDIGTPDDYESAQMLLNTYNNAVRNGKEL
ncbi:MAG: NTP transferase domain-containing protein [Alteromonadaceae bacterium]|nr:NTP transferase domain-containing protein [Alteromonadaceae bacterium]